MSEGLDCPVYRYSLSPMGFFRLEPVPTEPVVIMRVEEIPLADPLIAEALQRRRPRIVALAAPGIGRAATWLAQPAIAALVSDALPSRLLVTAVRRVIAGETGVVHGDFGDEAYTAQPLSARETQVVQQWSLGLSLKDIAGSLGISAKSVETYKRRAMEKLGCHNRHDLVRVMDHGTA